MAPGAGAALSSPDAGTNATAGTDPFGPVVVDDVAHHVSVLPGEKSSGKECAVEGCNRVNDIVEFGTVTGPGNAIPCREILGLDLTGASESTTGDHLASVCREGEDTALDGLSAAGLTHNLIPVTLGNIVGGTLLVAGVYWFAYLRPKKRDPA